jgi:hypothetical protein
MNALTAALFGYLYDSISIQILGRVPKIDSKRRASSVLRLTVWIGIDGRDSNARLCCSPAYTAARIQQNEERGKPSESYSAISPLLAIKMEVKGVTDGTM